jgi:predicted DNA binding CopG/RHH family protein
MNKAKQLKNTFKRPSDEEVKKRLLTELENKSNIIKKNISEMDIMTYEATVSLLAKGFSYERLISYVLEGKPLSIETSN